MKILALWVVIGAIAVGGELSPHVRITKTGMQVSGVVIGDGRILTVAHAWTSGKVRVEFVGTDESVVRQGEVVFADEARDLAVVLCNTRDVTPLMVGKASTGRVVIRGFSGLDSRMIEIRGNVLKEDVTGENGEGLLVIGCKAVPGLSGSGVIDDGAVIGIQSAGGSKTFCASSEQIVAFLASAEKISKRPE